MHAAMVVLYLVTVSVRFVLVILNRRFRARQGHTIPQGFGTSIDPETLKRGLSYQADREAFGLFALAGTVVVTVPFFFGGGLALYDRWVTQMIPGGGAGGVVGGVAFFVGLYLITAVLELPFDAFAVFRIEGRHGFNRMTPQLFIGDWLKSTALASVLLAGISAAGLWLYQISPNGYWVWFWLISVSLGVILMFITPYVIEPLFIKTAPLASETLAASVRGLAARANVQVAQVLQVDASRRSAHTNAYFTGIGRVKRVVLFDTLLERLSPEEILAVLGHELGHWKLRHVTQRLLASALVLLIGLYLAARLLAWEGFAESVGLVGASFPARVILIGFIISIVGFFLTPLSAYWSRAHEWEADAFSAELTGNPQALAAALVKLARDNLSNLHPHPGFAAFYYSHPPADQRVRRLTA